MSRVNFGEAKTKPTSLDALIPQYAANKIELDSYKKICDDENAQIKTLMKDGGTDTYAAGGYVAKRIVTTRESVNEDRLLTILHKHHIDAAIKTKEYVDMDALEDYLYNNSISDELVTDMASCRSTTEVVQLRVTLEKKKKEDE